MTNQTMETSMIASQKSADIKKEIANSYVTDEAPLVSSLEKNCFLSVDQQKNISSRTSHIIQNIRKNSTNLAYVDQLMLEYNLSSAEGILLMRIAEALLRTPDQQTAAHFLRDRLLAGNWQQHSSQSSSKKVNLTTEGLRFAMTWVEKTGYTQGKSLIAKLGDAVLLKAMQHAMQIMGNHFVLGSDIGSVVFNSYRHKKSSNSEIVPPLYSFDMLGEAAITEKDAQRYHTAYVSAATFLADAISDTKMLKTANLALNDGLSVKLSALYPRYDILQKTHCLPVLLDRVKQLALISQRAGFGLTIDAEEVERLELSLEIIAGLLADPDLQDWQGLGIVVQAYQKRAYPVLKQVILLAQQYQRKISVRLVKGAYWDREIKRAQELGLASYPVFTRKEHTDISYLACARLLLSAPAEIYPQFATHNVQTALSILEIASTQADFEFQRLHGMGQDLHHILQTAYDKRSRIYAPVGEHTDLLPYLVRRLLENGANSSFVNQLYDDNIQPLEIGKSPFTIAQQHKYQQSDILPPPRDTLYGQRLSALGLDVYQENKIEEIEKWLQINQPVILGEETGEKAQLQIQNPADTQDLVGYVLPHQVTDIAGIYKELDYVGWQKIGMEARAKILAKAADLLEDEMADFLPLLVREAGKIWLDAIAEIREAVDFCRYYAHQCQEKRLENRVALGHVVCISPWNFPLAIFLGQVVAALSVGNAVLAKPAPQTPLVGQKAVDLLYRAGVPRSVLQLVIGGAEIGSALTQNSLTHGICFTGSTASAKKIAATLADTQRGRVPLIAETGGLNAMIIDSTALLERAVMDVITSAFQSAGQRCSACRIVCVQEDVADAFLDMLSGAMAALKIGLPSDKSTDVGPVIDESAAAKIRSYIADKQKTARLVYQVDMPKSLKSARFIAPAAFELKQLSDITEEIFGPVLHIVRFAASDFNQVISDINALGYGLTLGCHSRIDHHISDVCHQAHVGNIYINRNQIGAIVGVQPFGGEGLSGTGPKAGGPFYLSQLMRSDQELQEITTSSEIYPERSALHFEAAALIAQTPLLDLTLPRLAEVVQLLNALILDAKGRAQILEEFKKDASEKRLPGPTGEDNYLRLLPRGRIAIKCPEEEVLARYQISKLLSAGNILIIEQSQQSGWLQKEIVKTQMGARFLKNCLFVSQELFQEICKGELEGVAVPLADTTPCIATVLKREGAIIPIFKPDDPLSRYMVERTVSIDTTAAGGNVELMAQEA